MRRASLFTIGMLLAAGVAWTNVSGHSAGPDAGGYLVADSSEPDGPAYAFRDVSVSGTRLALRDNMLSASIPLGFAFRFYGYEYDSVHVSSNGFLSFGPQTSHGFFGWLWSFPNSASVDNLVAGYWSDLDPGAGGTVHHRTLGAAPDRVFVVQFTDVPHYRVPNATVTMQFQLHESSDALEIHYAKAVSDGKEHVVGIENWDGSVGLLYKKGNFGLENVAVRFAKRPLPTTPELEAPTVALAGESVTVTARAEDPVGLGVAYRFHFGAAGGAMRVPASGFLASGTPASASFTYATPDEHGVRVRAETPDGRASRAEVALVDVRSRAPLDPIVSGPPVTNPLTPAEFSVATTDPEGDGVAYWIDWGDGSVERVPAVGHLPSGEAARATHAFASAAAPQVSAWAEDAWGAMSPLAPPASSTPPIRCDPPLDVVLLVDRSGSMYGEPMAVAKVAARRLTENLTENDQSALVTYNYFATVNQKLTFDHDATLRQIDRLTAPIFGATGTGTGIAASRNEFLASGRGAVRPVLVVLTDGDANWGLPPDMEARLTHAEGIEVFVVGLGTSVNEAGLREIASEPVDEHVFVAPNATALLGAFAAITEGLTGASVASEAYVAELSVRAAGGPAPAEAEVRRIAHATSPPAAGGTAAARHAVSQGGFTVAVEAAESSARGTAGARVASSAGTADAVEVVVTFGAVEVLRASLVQAEAFAAASRSGAEVDAGATRLGGLTVLGVPVSVDVPPGTAVPVPGFGEIILGERDESRWEHGASLGVAALRARLTAAAPFPVEADIAIGVAFAAAACGGAAIEPPAPPAAGAPVAVDATPPALPATP